MASRARWSSGRIGGLLLAAARRGGGEQPVREHVDVKVLCAHRTRNAQHGLLHAADLAAALQQRAPDLHAQAQHAALVLALRRPQVTIADIDWPAWARTHPASAGTALVGDKGKYS